MSSQLDTDNDDFLTHVFPGASPAAIQFRREVLYLTRSSMTRPTASTMTNHRPACRDHVRNQFTRPHEDRTQGKARNRGCDRPTAPRRASYWSRTNLRVAWFLRTKSSEQGLVPANRDESTSRRSNPGDVAFLDDVLTQCGRFPRR